MLQDLYTTGEDFTVEDLRNTDFLYYVIAVSPESLKILYDNQYEFHKNQAEFTQTISLDIDSSITSNTCKHVLYLAQQLYQFRKIEFYGSDLNLEVAFNGIKSLLMSEFHQKIMFECLFNLPDSPVFDNNIEVPSLYKDNINQDTSKIQQSEMKL